MVESLVGSQLLAHGLVALLNIILIIAARPISEVFNDGRNTDFQQGLLRVMAYMLLILTIADLALVWLLPGYHQFFIRLGLSLVPVYGAIFIFNILSHFIRKRFGLERKIDDKLVYLDTYNSRLMELFAVVVLVLVVIYALIKIWGLDSLLETTGIFGLIFAFLALTNQIWAPDIYYGMVILNSDMMSDGDTVRLEGDSSIYIINKVTFIYTILLDIQNNHRSLIRNSKLINMTVENLTKRASIDGLRESLKYNIGYPDIQSSDNEERIQELQKFKRRIENMFTAVAEALKDSENNRINGNCDFEWALTDAGDYALTYTLWYYLEAIPNTKVTRTVRQHLLGTRFMINQKVFEESIAHGVDLSTPILVHQSEKQGRRPLPVSTPAQRAQQKKPEGNNGNGGNGDGPRETS
nr:mechanosensitive ion channel family protein [Litorivivens lipolytica]